MDNLKKSKQNPIPCKCEICDKEFKTDKGLKYHFNITHKSEKILQCNICQKIFNTQSKLIVHTTYLLVHSYSHQVQVVYYTALTMKQCCWRSL